MLAGLVSDSVYDLVLTRPRLVSDSSRSGPRRGLTETRSGPRRGLTETRSGPGRAGPGQARPGQGQRPRPRLVDRELIVEMTVPIDRARSIGTTVQLRGYPWLIVRRVVDESETSRRRVRHTMAERPRPEAEAGGPWPALPWREGLFLASGRY